LDQLDHVGEMFTKHDVLEHHGEAVLEVGVAGGRRQPMAQPELPQRLLGWVGSHVRPAVDHHAPEQVASHVHRARQPLGQ